ncbi:MAG: succinate dehydrogenase / fumarate reductase, iron-sulfur subunit [Thermoplasmata archaeon]|jgi:succinate dehydrogenase / fumarate reductase iron-sulfur subunit|nr:succinate dehydrogenase / fumarate reductase, iron-sulfur subunit [Thermoplasmata archaeon]
MQTQLEKLTVTLRVARYNPEAGDKRARFEEYRLNDCTPMDRVLDLLIRIKGEQSGSLAYRRSCAHGICGSDAMVINGKNRLACKTLVRDLSGTITVEPLKGLPVKKDLIVDMEPFFKSYESVMPYQVTKHEPSGKERLQSPADQAKIDDQSKCIMCAACTTSCPSFWANDQFVGPAAVVQASRFLFDTRDEGNAERLQVLNDYTGVWRCRTIFNCVEACPQGIDITRHIGNVKKALLYGNTSFLPDLPPPPSH